MVRSAKQVYRLTGRAAMYSPGAPSLGNEIERRFWQQTATGITSEKAAQEVGASQAVGSRWFRYRGGTPLFMSKPTTGRYLSFPEREEIALLSVASRWGSRTVSFSQLTSARPTLLRGANRHLGPQRLDRQQRSVSTFRCGHRQGQKSDPEPVAGAWRWARICRQR